MCKRADMESAPQEKFCRAQNTIVGATFGRRRRYVGIAPYEKESSCGPDAGRHILDFFTQYDSRIVVGRAALSPP